jgi:hypothetical protein
MQLHRSRVAVALVTALAVMGSGLATTATLAAPQTVRYPSGACPDTGAQGLNQCVAQVDAGSTIVLVDEIIDEYVIIDKSLTLRGESRTYRPILSQVILDDAGPTPLDITVEDIRVRRVIRAEAIDTGSGHRVTIRGVEVGRGESNAEGIRILASAPMTLIVEHSWIRSAASQYSGLAFYTNRDGGTSRFRAVGNRITQAGSAVGGSGINVSMNGSGTTFVDLYANSIVDVAGSNAGGASGILVRPDDSVQADVDVVGNTVARSGSAAFLLWNSVGASGRARLDLFDNNLSHSRQGVVITEDVAGTTTLQAGHNNTFQNTQGNYYEGRGRGSGDLHVDPRFVDLAGGDLRLRTGSPLIDRGLVCQPGGLAIRDAAGKHRLAGPSVDVGAYERGAGAATGKVVLGTSRTETLLGSKGADILCGFGGNDRLCARDGTRGNDFVDGGAGRDKARTDLRDRRRSVEASGGC